MKTISDMLREVPEHILLERLCDLHDSENWQQLRIGYIKSLDELRRTAPVPTDMICRVIWDVTEDGAGCVVDGQKADSDEVFGLDFTPWGEWLSMPVRIEPRSAADRLDLVLAEIVWEMTFHGFSYGAVKEAGDEVANSVGKINEIVASIEASMGNPDLKDMSPEEIGRAIEKLTKAIDEDPDATVLGIFTPDGEEMPLPKDTKH